jgi:perosamine synthetase
MSIPHSRPWITQEDIEVVTGSLREKSVSSWQYAKRLSNILCDYSGLPYCQLYASGTLALRAGVLQLNLAPGSDIAVPAYTCIEVVRGILSAGMHPVVCDCDRNGLLCPIAVKKAMRKTNIKAAISVHQFGLLNLQMEKLAEEIPIIEDCCHVPPKSYLASSIGIIGSFEGTKLMGAGEGGYLMLKSQPRECDVLNPILLGAGLADTISAAAISQLNRLDANLTKRERIAGTYRKAFHGKSMVNGARAAWFRFIIRMRSIDEVQLLIKSAEIAQITVRRPIMPHPLHHYFTEHRYDCPMSHQLWETLASIPIYPDLEEDEVYTICQFINDWAKHTTA